MHQPPLTVTDALAFEEDENTKSDIIVCIDACQMRVTPEYIRNQLSKVRVTAVGVFHYKNMNDEKG
jgi:hypothetical protein